MGGNKKKEPSCKMSRLGTRKRTLLSIILKNENIGKKIKKGKISFDIVSLSKQKSTPNLSYQININIFSLPGEDFCTFQFDFCRTLFKWPILDD